MSKRDLILATALELFVHQGIGATATAQIAKAAGVATGTLFHHFPSKAQLVSALYLNVKTQLAEAMRLEQGEGDLAGRARQYWDRGMDWALAHPESLRFMSLVYHRPGQDGDLKRQAMLEILGFIPELLRQGQAEGRLRPVPEDLALEQCQGQFMTAAQFFIDHPDKAGDGHYRDAAFDLFWLSMARH
ncbi:TetR/AcrR family transcriptional regulator [Ferrimonas balearica]|uniref:TetR/AcrR family transcriptional regulator n=1 Tax=Ferrimonas balearica TaxID=44012 RepID=UPI001C992145|nr:TetR/AcrR family transcriptional regulator [Ferrimonas balearica]MBY5993530.1 TetR/AcrR family transcriptional regulator [Ferrimonas balearica]